MSGEVKFGAASAGIGWNQGPNQRTREGTCWRGCHAPTGLEVALLRRRLLDNVPVSDLREELGLRPPVFYRWQKEHRDVAINRRDAIQPAFDALLGHNRSGSGRGPHGHRARQTDRSWISTLVGSRRGAFVRHGTV